MCSVMAEAIVATVRALRYAAGLAGYPDAWAPGELAEMLAQAADGAGRAQPVLHRQRGDGVRRRVPPVRRAQPLLGAHVIRTRYVCPVDGCTWTYTEEPPGPMEWGSASVSMTMPNVEAILAGHQAGHAPVEYLRTIMRLRDELTAARWGLQG